MLATPTITQDHGIYSLLQIAVLHALQWNSNPPPKDQLLPLAAPCWRLK